MRSIWHISILLVCLLLAYQAQAGQDKNNWFKHFDSQQLAAAEVTMWRAYYTRDYYTLWQTMVTMLSNQFDMPTAKAVYLSGSIVQAALRFRQLPRTTTPQQYQQDVLPDIIVFYTGIKKTLHAPWQADEVAQAELDWWVARRIPQQNNPRVIGGKIAKLYSLLYGRQNAFIQQAGYLRAKAAYLRDQQARRAKNKVDWVQIQTMLEQSYRQLEKGIQ